MTKPLGIAERTMLTNLRFTIQDDSKKETLLTLITALFFDRYTTIRVLYDDNDRSTAHVKIGIDSEPIQTKLGMLHFPRWIEYSVHDFDEIRFKNECAPYTVENNQKRSWTTLNTLDSALILSTKSDSDPVPSTVTLDDITDPHNLAKYREIIKNFLLQVK